MEKPDCLEAGKVLKPFGYKGEVLASIRSEFQKIILEQGLIFIEINEELVPLFFSSIEEESGDIYRISFEDINDSDQAKSLNAPVIWLPKELIPTDFLDNNPYAALENYTVVDKRFGEVGVVKAILDLPSQQLLSVYKGRKEVLIPLTEDYILSIDRKKRQIEVQTPDGLIETYLG